MAILLLAGLSLPARAQQTVAIAEEQILPDAPGFARKGELAETGAGLPGSISGVVHDGRGALVPGAQVLFTATGPDGSGVGESRTAVSASDGRFRLEGVRAGSFRLSVIAGGFRTGVVTGSLRPGESLQEPPIVLAMLGAYANVVVTASQEEVAAAQVEMQEKQNIFGVFPNYFVSYVPDAAPMTPKQKFGLAWKSSIEPGSFAVSGMVAGVEQATNGFAGYGQGVAGYGKRFGASFGDDLVSTMLGGAVLPSLLRQDPRYFYRGTGSFRSRALYALSRVVVCRSDKGRSQPNYSNVLGNVASAGISNLYYPSEDRHGAGLTVENALVGTALGGFSNLFQEFVARRVTPRLPSLAPETDVADGQLAQNGSEAKTSPE